MDSDSHSLALYLTRLPLSLCSCCFVISIVYYLNEILIDVHMYSHIYFSYLPHSYTKDGVFLPLNSSECIPKFAI